MLLSSSEYLKQSILSHSERGRKSSSRILRFTLTFESPSYVPISIAAPAKKKGCRSSLPITWRLPYPKTQLVFPNAPAIRHSVRLSTLSQPKLSRSRCSQEQPMPRVYRAGREAAYRNLVHEYHCAEEFDRIPLVFADPSIHSSPYHPVPGNHPNSPPEGSCLPCILKKLSSGRSA